VCDNISTERMQPEQADEDAANVLASISKIHDDNIKPDKRRVTFANETIEYDDLRADEEPEQSDETPGNGKALFPEVAPTDVHQEAATVLAFMSKSATSEARERTIVQSDIPSGQESQAGITDENDTAVAAASVHGKIQKAADVDVEEPLPSVAAPTARHVSTENTSIELQQKPPPQPQPKQQRLTFVFDPKKDKMCDKCIQAKRLLNNLGDLFNFTCTQAPRPAPNSRTSLVTSVKSPSSDESNRGSSSSSLTVNDTPGTNNSPNPARVETQALAFPTDGKRKSLEIEDVRDENSRKKSKQTAREQEDHEEQRKSPAEASSDRIDSNEPNEIVLHPHDVVREDGHDNANTLKERLYPYCQEVLAQYQRADQDAATQQRVVDSVVWHVQCLDPPGRFLEYSSSTGKYTNTALDQARAQVAAILYGSSTRSASQQAELEPHNVVVWGNSENMNDNKAPVVVDRSGSVILGPSIEVKKRPLGPNFVPTNYCVICGKGKEKYNAVGNRRLRVSVTMSLERYANANRIEKSNIVSEIVDVVRGSHGAFVKYDKEKKMWYEIGDHLARYVRY